MPGKGVGNKSDIDKPFQERSFVLGKEGNFKGLSETFFPVYIVQLMDGVQVNLELQSFALVDCMVSGGGTSFSSVSLRLDMCSIDLQGLLTFSRNSFVFHEQTDLSFVGARFSYSWSAQPTVSGSFIIILTSVLQEEESHCILQ